MIPVEERGRIPEKIPLFRGHTAVVLDTDWYACSLHYALASPHAK